MIARVGEVAYKLKLPEKTLIHPVVHVSLLRRAQPPSADDQVRLPPAPPLDDADRHEDEPLVVLQRRQYLRGSTVRSQVLVQWSSMSESLATWEDELQLKARFPHALAWGQASVEGGANVTPVTTPKDHTASPSTSTGSATPQAAKTATPAPRRTGRVRQLSSRLDPRVWQL